MVKPKRNQVKTANEKKELKKHIDAISPHLTDIQKWDQVVEKALNPPDTSALEKQIRELEITNESLRKELKENDDECDCVDQEFEDLKEELVEAKKTISKYEALELGANGRILFPDLNEKIKDLDKTVTVQNQLIAVFRMIFMSRKIYIGQKEMEELLLQANDGYRQSNEEFIAKMLKVVEFVTKFQEDPRVDRHYNNLLEGRKDLDKHKCPLPIIFTEALDYATCVDEMRANINGLFVMPMNKDPKANKMEKEEIENQIMRSIRLNPEEFRQKMLKDTAGLKEFLKVQDKTQPAHAGALEDAMRLEKIIQNTPSKDTIENSNLDKQD